MIKVKQANFYHTIGSKFITPLDTVTGYGTISNLVNETITGSITDPTGLQDAVFYKTGLLTGKITNGGSYTWSNLTLTGSGQQNRVFANYITGYKQASNVIEFINIYGSDLQDGDTITIANSIFTYRKSPTNIVEFNSPTTLVNILNSGATGGFNDQGYSILQTSVGVTGYIEDRYIKLFSFLRSGEVGNTIYIYKNTQNINAIKLPSRYFSGGVSLRPLINNWIGNFTNTFDLTIENSGFYTKQLGPISTFGTVSGVSWINNFSGSYIILTGFKDPRRPSSYSGVRLQFNTQINKYSGTTILPQNQSTLYTGLNIEISAPTLYNISGNIAKYTFSGDNFIFQDYIEG